MSYQPLRPPQSDAEWARNTEKRLRSLESSQSLRVGEWVITPQGDDLIASKPGQTLNVGNVPVATVVEDMTRGFVTASQVGTAITTGGTEKVGPLQEAGNFLQTKWSDLVNTITGAVNAFTGVGDNVDGTAWDGTAAALGFSDQASTVGGLSDAVQKIQADIAASGGVSAVINFSGRANSSSLGSDFNQFYSGPGSSTFGITNGRAIRQYNFGSERQCIALYNVTDTNTDYQQVGSSYPTGNETWAFDRNQDPRVYLVARSDASATTYVFVELWAQRLVMGCYVSGTRYVFFTDTSFRFTSGSAYWLIAGTASGVRTFQLWKGSTPVAMNTGSGTTTTYTDVSSISQYGAGYRYGGLGLRDMASGLLHVRPAETSAWVLTDRIP